MLKRLTSIPGFVIFYLQFKGQNNQAANISSKFSYPVKVVVDPASNLHLIF